MLLVCGMLVSLPFIWLNYLNHNVIQKGKKKKKKSQMKIQESRFFFCFNSVSSSTFCDDLFLLSYSSVIILSLLSTGILNLRVGRDLMKSF